jgi:LmeA-like phospholipid-binding
MRGCLSVLVLAAVFLLAGAWFAGPQLAAFVVETGLSTAGFHGTNTQVAVSADPPFELLTGRADAVAIDSDGATVGQFTAAHLELTLHRADLIGRHAETVEGTLDDVTMRTSDSSIVKASEVRLSGDPSAAEATIHVNPGELTGIATATINRELGVDAEDVTFTAPDRVSFKVGKSTIAGQLVIHNGGLSVIANVPGSPRVDLISAGGGLRLTGVAVKGSGLELKGILDVEDLLG